MTAVPQAIGSPELGRPVAGPAGAIRYYLSSHAFACRTARSWYVLDVARDGYLRIDGPLFDLLLPLLDGWAQSARTLTEASQSVPTSIIELATQLELRGILTRSGDSTHVPTRSAVDLPEQSLLVPTRHLKLAGLMSAPAFFIACVRAARALKNLTLEENVRRLRARKQVGARTDFNLSRAERLLTSFAALRPFYPQDYLCLFDSLALLEFLALYGLHPDWVFGVTDEPFQAHCWVQYGHCALNESVEFASLYTPIMAV